MLSDQYTKRGFIMAAALGCSLLTSCSVRQPGVPTPQDPEQDHGPAKPVDVSHVPDAVPRLEPRSRYGNPSNYTVNGKQYQVMGSSEGYREKGIASWYGLKFHGRRTSSWEPYDMYKMTAAHKSLPLPSYVQVVNLENGKQVVVRVNDRGPFHAQRVIDLSYAAASRLGVLERGTALVEVTAIDPTVTRRATDNGRTSEKSHSPGIFLQVGAFTSNLNAIRQKNTLRESVNWPVRIEDSRHNGLTISRVKIGPLENVGQLDELVLQLGKLGINDTHVVIQ